MNDDQPQHSSQRDMQLTAYALGELNDAEQAEFAATCDEAERLAADDIARLGGLLRRAARVDACPPQSDDLRRAIEARLTERKTLLSGPLSTTLPLPITLQTTLWTRRRVWLPLSLAASLLVIATTVATLMNLPADRRQVAKNNFKGLIGDNSDEEPLVVGLTAGDELVDEGLSQLESNAESMSDAEAPNAADAFEFSVSAGDVSKSDLSVTEKPHPVPSLQRNGGTVPGNQPRKARYSERRKSSFRVVGGRGLPDGDNDTEMQNGQGAKRPNLGSTGKHGDDGENHVPGDRMGPGGAFGDAGGGPGGSGSEGKKGDEMRLSNVGTNKAKSLGQRIKQSDPQGESDGELSGGGKPGGGQSDSQENPRSGIVFGVRGGDMPGGGNKPGGGNMPGSPDRRETLGGEDAASDHRGRAAGGRGEARNESEKMPRPIVGQGGGFRLDGFSVLENTEDYAPITENIFLSAGEHPLSTFSIDVDTASYANVRRFINTHALPPPNAVRIEELINYFSYDYPQPEGDEPFSVTTEVAGCPWNAEHRLLRVGLKGRALDPLRRPASNLVFLLDVSGSMDEPNKLPLVKEALQLLTRQLSENDRVAIVVYAGNSGLVLPPTRGNESDKICAAIAALAAGGSTNGGQGIQLAYDAAQAHFVPGGTNRVILATDGDFNVGVTDPGDLVRLIEEKAAGGVGLSALGFGAGNLKDATLEKLADRGNGNYAYIDTAGEARKVLVEQLCGTLVTIAKDVKLQVEFNPAQVGAYRLIGYENRVLREQDFNDDRKDAGEIGAGHAVTALYELVPAGKPAQGGVDALKYQRVPQLADAAARNELATLKLRYKPPEGEKSKLLEHVITDTGLAYGRASADFKFAASVAACGMLLRGSQYAGDATWDAVIELAGEGISEDSLGYRSEFLELVKKAKAIAGK